MTKMHQHNSKIFNIFLFFGIQLYFMLPKTQSLHFGSAKGMLGMLEITRKQKSHKMCDVFIKSVGSQGQIRLPSCLTLLTGSPHKNILSI